MIGYILLISFSVILGAVLYQNLKTYVPTESIDCPDSVSIFLKNYTCENSVGGNSTLTLNLKNNGKFNIAGYFVYATNSTEQELATIDLSNYFDENAEDLGVVVKNAVVFEMVSENTMNVGEEKVSEFDIPPNILINSIEIVPVRFQEVNNKMMFVSCGGAKISEEIICPDCSCSLTTCVGATCENGIGETCYGALTESVCPTANTIACGYTPYPTINCGTTCEAGTLCIQPGEICNGIACVEGAI